MARGNWKNRIASVTTCSLLLSPPMIPVFGQSAAPKKTAAPATPAPEVPADGGWPRAYNTSSGAMMVVYQPQVASWEDQKHMVLYLAISYTPKGDTKPALGSVKVESDTSVALSERLVSFSELKVTQPNFPTLKPEQVRVAVDEIDARDSEGRAGHRARSRARAPRQEPDHAEERRGRESGSAGYLLQHRRPRCSSTSTAIRSGAPSRTTISSSPSTPTGISSSTPSASTCGTTTAGSRPQRSNGPWKAAGKLPDSFAKLPADGNWTEVKAAIPGKKLGERTTAEGLRQHQAGRNDPADRRAELSARVGHDACCG